MLLSILKKFVLLILGQKWSENDVMADKRKQSESTESLDEGAFHLNFIS